MGAVGACAVELQFLRALTATFSNPALVIAGTVEELPSNAHAFPHSSFDFGVSRVLEGLCDEGFYDLVWTVR